jgi:hypothetical protein
MPQLGRNANRSLGGGDDISVGRPRSRPARLAPAHSRPQPSPTMPVPVMASQPEPSVAWLAPGNAAMHSGSSGRLADGKAMHSTRPLAGRTPPGAATTERTWAPGVPLRGFASSHGRSSPVDRWRRKRPLWVAAIPGARPHATPYSRSWVVHGWRDVACASTCS